MALIRRIEREFTTQVRRGGERHALKTRHRWGLRIPEARERVGGRGLPAVAQALRKAGLQGVVTGPTGANAHRNQPVLRVGAASDVGERIVGAGGRVERQVRIVDDVLLVIALAVDVVSLEGHGAAQLVRQPDRGLPRPREVGAELGRCDQFGNRALQASRHVPDMAEALVGLLECRQRLAVEGICREVRPAVVGDLDHRQPDGLRHPEGVDRQRLGEVQPRSASHDRLVTNPVRAAQPRLEVVRVVGTPGLDERLHGVVIRLRVHAEIVPDAQIERQLRRDLPVVLQPGAELRPDIARREVADAQAIVPRDGGDRR